MMPSPVRPYWPLSEWLAWRVAELISPRSFRGRKVLRLWDR
jgi:hypothetical protein